MIVSSFCVIFLTYFTCCFYSSGCECKVMEFDGRQCATSIPGHPPCWETKEANINTLLIPCKPRRLSCFRLTLILFVKFLSVCGIRSLFLFVCFATQKLTGRIWEGDLLFFPLLFCYLLLISLVVFSSQRAWES